MRMRYAFACWLALLTAATATAQGTPLPPATLSGVVRDSTGKPIAAAEIIVRELNRSVRANAEGHFVVADVAPGRYDVWFRRLGYESTQFNWAARTDERTEVAVTLYMIPRLLDPVVVRAKEDKMMRGRARIVGIVIDSTGNPIDEAEVQLIGANRTAMTRSNGGFVFPTLPVGPYVVRVRKLGYSPNVLHLELQEGEEREVAIRIRRLAQMLDAVEINEQSGYGRDQVAWDELDKRKRWRSSREIVLGREELKRYYSLPLDMAVRSMKGGVSSPAPRAVTSRGNTQRARPPDPNTEDVCVLLNGTQAMRRPLRLWGADDLDLIEIYPSGTELSGTVAWRMNADTLCQADGFRHPTYYVLWLKPGR